MFGPKTAETRPKRKASRLKSPKFVRSVAAARLRLRPILAAAALRVKPKSAWQRAPAQKRPKSGLPGWAGVHAAGQRDTRHRRLCRSPLVVKYLQIKSLGFVCWRCGRNGNLWLGLCGGPYFRLSRLGADKKSGLGFSPYFTLNALRPETEDKAGNIKVPTKAVLVVGGGLRADIFINELFGLNLGFELLGGKVDLNGKDEWKTAVPLFGAVFYGGVTLSF